MPSSESRVQYMDELLVKANELKLADDIQWLNLVHYKSNFWGGYKSQVDGVVFFMSAEGKIDPHKELEATINGLFSTAPNKITEQEPRCQFPARYLWLKKILQIDEPRLPYLKCEKYGKFVDQLSAESVTLVFSSYFLNSPSSAFGHTLLRINSSKAVSEDGKHHELLDHGVNYGAEITTSNPIVYAFSGLLGTFRGTFINIPYYYKVREYNDFEARDLWSYDLELTPEEIQLLVAHIWELGSTYYDYFYFTENCSYHMFSILEAAAPRLQLTDLLPYYVIPSDTVRRLMTVPGLVTRVSYRPSIRTQFEHRLKQLNSNEYQIFADFIHKKDETKLSGLPDPTQARILDAALDYIEYQYAEDLLKEKSTEVKSWKQAVMAQRAALGITSPELEISQPDLQRPEMGHGIRRVTFGLGGESGLGSFGEIGFRFAMTDMLDTGPGYLQGGTVEFLAGNIRYWSSPSHFEIDDLTLLRLFSLSPLTEFRRNISFKIEAGAKRITDNNCNRCIAGNLEGGPGASISLSGDDDVLAFGIADFQIAYAPGFISYPIRMGAGPLLGILYRVTDDFKASASLGYRYHLFSTYKETLESRIEGRYGFDKYWAINLSFASHNIYSEVSLSGMYYW